MDDRHFMQFALQEAHSALVAGDLPVGAVVVLNNKVIGSGRRVGKSFGKLDHAEARAVKEAIGKYPDEARQMSVYTTLEPCVMCFGTILNCRIPKIAYAFPDVYGGATNIPIKSLPVRHQQEELIIIRNTCKDEAHKLFYKFFTTTNEKFWQDATNPFVKQVLTSLTT